MRAIEFGNLKRIAVATALLVLALVSGFAIAQSYPSRPIQAVIAVAPGSSGDILLRQLTPKLSEILGQPIVVMNRGGGNGVIGTASVAKAAPDGYTLLFAYNQTIAVNPHLIKDLPYDPVKDFTPIARVVVQPLVFVVTKALPINSMAEFVAYGKANPGKLNYPSSGSGTSSHLGGAYISQLAGIKTVHVPYNSVPQALVDLARGELSFMIYPYAGLVASLKAGRIQALATTGPQRASFMPDVPTMVELGYPDYVIVPWFGFYAPAGTPKEIVDKLNRAIEQTLKDPKVLELIAATGSEPWFSSPEELARFTRSEIDRYGKVVEVTGAKAE
jgi:tripartite-type tricarboxylate transporter receptor subunit TctC